jgi:cyclopropane-fatty-acyl-phospholipid synthase
MLADFGDPALQVRLWDGESFGASRTSDAPTLRIEDRRALWRLLLDPDMQFGELYMADRLRVEGDLVRFLEIAFRACGEWRPGLLGRLRSLRPSNTRSRARSNVHRHYDLGNGFYALWLDAEAMQYTCAYYPREGLSLEEAQRAKMHHVSRKLQLRPGERVIEAGCGWGGFARFMAREYGVRVTAYNLSIEQVRHAREAAAREGLGGAVEFVHDDYREIRGECDVFVSVGMLEHVGPRHYRELGSVIDRCLRPAGRGLIHTIGRNRPLRLSSWIDRRIFHGGHPPTLGEMAPIFEPHAFSVLDVENLRLHYARTLSDWLARFEANVGTIRRMYDDPFVRAWRLYLASSLASFSTGWLQLFQVLFARPGLDRLPWSRAHLYADEAPR